MEGKGQRRKEKEEEIIEVSRKGRESMRTSFFFSKSFHIYTWFG